MVLVNTKSMLKKAQKEGYAVGAFNTTNLEITKAILRAAEELNSPVILQVSVKAAEYAGLEEIVAIVSTSAKKSKVPVALHLDHGPSFEWAKKCILAGFTSVMIDSSALPYKDNVKVTKSVVGFAEKSGVSVEAEIGALKGVEDDVNVQDSVYTNPEQAVQFVKETNCSSLAIAIGTSHGPYKFEGGSKLDFKRLETISRLVKVPLVLHGASGVPKKIVEKIQKFGGKITGAQGVSDSHLKKAISLGICKINTDTDLRLAFDASLREFLVKKPEVYDPRTILSVTSDAIYELVKYKIKLFGSENKA